ncbi:RHS repeat-associated core domain-containing protein [Pseudoalteromonas sp. SSM20]|uniref:RHS repeat-associated core domain-containing protein n=1 Tax=Pseudoalteromonas sp. SSM20 TaxID=3139394 RepID=UPI003BA99212
MIAETDSLGSRLKTYLYGDDLISQTDSNNTTNTFHYDGLGSTHLLSSDTGEQSDTYNYLAFGEVLNKSVATDNNYLYTGEQFDGDLEQYYLRARYYDQNLGRMTQMDSWQGRQAKPISLSKYTYTASSPVHFVDPSGNTHDLPGSTVTFRVLSTLGNRSMHYLGKTYSRALFGYNRKDLAQEVFGIVGEALMDEVLAAYKEMLKEGRQGSAANKGTWAHSKFESRVKAMRTNWKKYNITIGLEEFRKSDGTLADFKRQKDILGLDVKVYYKGALVLAYDLKTGRGMSKKRRGRLKLHFKGVEVVEIMVTPRRGKK